MVAERDDSYCCLQAEIELMKQEASRAPEAMAQNLARTKQQLELEADEQRKKEQSGWRLEKSQLEEQWENSQQEEARARRRAEQEFEEVQSRAEEEAQARRRAELELEEVQRQAEQEVRARRRAEQELEEVQRQDGEARSREARSREVLRAEQDAEARRQAELQEERRRAKDKMDEEAIQGKAAAAAEGKSDEKTGADNRAVSLDGQVTMLSVAVVPSYLLTASLAEPIYQLEHDSDLQLRASLRKSPSRRAPPKSRPKISSRFLDPAMMRKQKLRAVFGTLTQCGVWACWHIQCTDRRVQGLSADKIF